jgi:glycosyltransferase involved in cell wall biosynthesis
MVSIVIPAHNEERVIARCLAALPVSEAEVVVVCNGCTDQTAAVASAVDPAIRVEQIAEASKTAALNHGDAIATTFPRVYLDADAVLSPGAIETITAPLRSRDAMVAGPSVIHDVNKSSAIVRAYYRIWTRLPSVGDDIVGCGAYALSEQARQRFDRFPDLLGDDHFVRDLFAPHERRVVSARSMVSAPRTLPDLVRRKVRVYTGNRMVYAVQPGGTARGRRRQAEWLTVVRRNPRLVPDVPAYLIVTVTAKALSRWRQRRGTHLSWGRDDSSRSAGDS